MITIDQASEMGAKGAEPTETERLLFEAWMRGHCWLVQGDWDGKSYVHESENTGYLHPDAMLTRQLWAAWRDRAALADQPAQPEWIPVTQELLNQQHSWLYQPMWIVTKHCDHLSLIQGCYEWQQGRYPDRFLTDTGNVWAFDCTHVMPIVKPTLPAIEAAHGIKENT